MRIVIFFFVCFYCFLIDSYGQTGDETDLIFNDSSIHHYYLTFEAENWAEQLTINKEENDEAYTEARFTYVSSQGDSIILDPVGVRYKGNSSYQLAKDMPKKSFKLKFDKYEEFEFFGCKRLNLNNCVEDPSYMREKLGYDVIRNYIPAPRVAYATLTVNDTLIGIFAQVEQVDKGFLERNFGDNDGNLYKASDHGSPLDFKGPNQADYEDWYELKTNEDENDWYRFVNFLRLLNETSDADFVSAVSNVFDFESALRHFAWTMVLSHFDSYTGSGRNFYLYDNPTTGKFTMIPWDVNMAFGQFSNGWDVITNSPVQIPNLVTRPLNRRIIENDSLKGVYLSYMREMIEGPASTAAISAEADRIKAVINDAVQAEPVESKFYSCEDFFRNVDSNVVIGSGLSAQTIYGIKTFSELRNTELTRMIAAGVKRQPVRQHFGTNGLDYSSNNKGIVIRISVNDGSTFSPLELRLFDSRGRVLKVKELHANRTAVIDVSDVPVGIYLIAVKSRSKVFSGKISITR
jgi:spore coat protein CotH